jgi:superoxide reductase
MKNELLIKRCAKCGAMVKVLEDCTCDNCGIRCCGENMEVVKANSTDAAVEKHVPTYQIIDDEIVVTVNHGMEKEHFIEWISLVKENTEVTVKLYPEQEAIARFPYMRGSTIYAYCNKHGLWSAEVE